MAAAAGAAGRGRVGCGEGGGVGREVAMAGMATTLGVAVLGIVKR